ncbi:MAG: hypothetical protein ACOYCD_01305 [Kiritimatiellia bacterium]|jgi:hypothetical protein
MKKANNIRLPRDPFLYIGLWQMLTFIMLLLLIWVNELRDISGFYFDDLPDHPSLVRGCVLTAAVLFTAIITIGNTYIQQKRILRTLVAICAKCRRVRINDDFWQAIEDYISDNSLLSFSHGLCPECMEETMQSVAALKNNGQPNASSSCCAKVEPKPDKAASDHACTSPE